MTDILQEDKAERRRKRIGDSLPEIPEGLPLWHDAAATMNIDVAVNDDGQVWVIHDKPFPSYLEWIEFDTDTRMMSFVTAQGKIQDLGMEIHAPMDEYLCEAKKVCVVMVRNNAVRDMGFVPLTVQGYGLIGGTK